MHTDQAASFLLSINPMKRRVSFLSILPYAVFDLVDCKTKVCTRVFCVFFTPDGPWSPASVPVWRASGLCHVSLSPWQNKLLLGINKSIIHNCSQAITFPTFKVFVKFYVILHTFVDLTANASEKVILLSHFFADQSPFISFYLSLKRISLTSLTFLGLICDSSIYDILHITSVLFLKFNKGHREQLTLQVARSTASPIMVLLHIVVSLI